MMKNKRDSWFNSGDMITRLIICTIILIIICSQSFVVGEKITLQLIGSIINHNSIYVLILVYFIFIRTKFGKKYFNYLNVILMLIYAISSFTSFLTVVQAFSLSSLLDFIVEALLLIYMIHTLFRDTLVWKELKLAKSPFNELSNANIFYSIVILSLSVLLVNLISIVALNGVLIAFLDAIYMVLLSRYIYLYREYLDENKIDANNDGNFDKLKENIKETIDDTSDKVKKIIDDADIDGKINTIKDKIVDTTTDIKESTTKLLKDKEREKKSKGKDDNEDKESSDKKGDNE